MESLVEVEKQENGNDGDQKESPQDVAEDKENIEQPVAEAEVKTTPEEQEQAKTAEPLAVPNGPERVEQTQIVEDDVDEQPMLCRKCHRAIEVEEAVVRGPDQVWCRPCNAILVVGRAERLVKKKRPAEIKCETPTSAITDSGAPSVSAASATEAPASMDEEGTCNEGDGLELNSKQIQKKLKREANKINKEAAKEERQAEAERKKAAKALTKKVIAMAQMSTRKLRQQMHKG
eukprot:s993_g12.t1